MARLEPRFESIMLSTRVDGVKAQKNGVRATLVDGTGERVDRLFDRVLVSVGRRPNSAGLGLENRLRL